MLAYLDFVLSPALAPAIPDELWMLARTDTEPRCWLPAIDEPREGENYLVCFSEADAKAAAQHQFDLLGIKCVPVRVK